MDDHTKREILSLDDQRLSQAEIARRTGTSQSTVSAYLRSASRARGRGGSQRTVDRARVVALWHEHHNQHTVARILGIVQAHVSQILNKKGIRPGRGSRQPTHALAMDQLAERYLAGSSTVELAREYRVDPEVVRRRLIRYGVQMRARGMKGATNYQYKHGRGYQPMHYFRRQSYEVAAICLQRPMPQGWVIHHLDEDPHNNAPQNLILFPSQKHHARFHQRQLTLQRSGGAVDAIYLALEIGGVQLPPPRVPIVFEPGTGRRGPSGSRASRTQAQPAS
ncbi:MAG: HNH endonuclease [Steroidobacteraceae bacterium]